jgi:hypothetical protein
VASCAHVTYLLCRVFVVSIEAWMNMEKHG